MSAFPETIFEYIIQEETAFTSDVVEIFDNYEWNFPTHVQTSVSFKNGKFLYATNDLRKKPPFRNIVLPILRLRYRAEDIDVKDVVLYVDDPDDFHLSFLVKKYHDDVFVIENDLDTFFDRAKEEKIDLGGCLVKKGEGAVPELIQLQSIAFCDQTNILGGPIGLKFYFSPDSLRVKAKMGWGEKANGADITLNELITLAKAEKDAFTATNGKRTNKTPGKAIEVYVVRGEMPESYLKNEGDPEKITNQVQVVAYYTTRDNKKKGVTLYKGKETENTYKFHNPEEIYGRALGLGGVEELFDSIISTNFAEIHKANALKSASKNVLYTNDEAYSNRNKIKDLENNEVTVVKDGGTINQVPLITPNIQLFTQSIAEWENHARELGGATDALLGKQPPAGTPFRLQERTVHEGKGLHEYRQGKFAKFIEEIYKDWIIPHIQREITKGTKFLSTLSMDELRYVADCVVRNQTNKMVFDRLVDHGEVVSEEEIEQYKQRVRTEFMQKGDKQFIELLEGEFKDKKLSVKVVVASKQKDLALLTDKFVNVLQQYIANPQLRQDPVANQILNKVLEASGLSGISLGMNYSATPDMPNNMQMLLQGNRAKVPMKQMGNKETMMV